MTIPENIHVFPMRYDDDMVNSVFFLEKETLVIVDTGIRQQRQLLLNEISKFRCERLYVVITHSHYDHIGNNYEVFKNYHPIFIAQLNSKDTIEDYAYQFHTLERSVRGHYTIPGSYKAAFFNHLDKEINVNISFNQTMRLHISGERTIELIHLPGHTLGDIGLIDKKTKTVVLSELIFEHSRKILIFIENYGEYVQSLMKLKKIIFIEDIKHLITSHNENILTGRKNILKAIEQNLDYVFKLKSIVRDYYNKGYSVEACTESVCDKYGKHFTPGAIITIKAILHEITDGSAQSKSVKT